jgi:hypothetical protein
MILTPIPREQLGDALDRFAASLGDPFARAVFRRIRATSPDRAAGAEARQHRREALSLARAFGMAIHPEGMQCSYNWDGVALNGATEAYVILHEVAHFALASPERRRLIDFGLGPGPDTLDRDAAESAAVLSLPAREGDEAAASFLGIVWEAQLGQPALASSEECLFSTGGVFDVSGGRATYQGPSGRSIAAARSASRRTLTQSPAATASFGAIHDPPTIGTFGKARYSRAERSSMPPVGQNATPEKTGARARNNARPPTASAGNSLRKLIPRSLAAITSEGVATPGR